MGFKGLGVQGASAVLRVVWLFAACCFLSGGLGFNVRVWGTLLKPLLPEKPQSAQIAQRDPASSCNLGISDDTGNPNIVP